MPQVVNTGAVLQQVWVPMLIANSASKKCAGVGMIKCFELYKKDRLLCASCGATLLSCHRLVGCCGFESQPWL